MAIPDLVGLQTVARQADAAFDDRVGDAQGGGADIRRVAVINDANGNIAIGVAYSNRSCVTATDLVYVEIDSDQSTATGAQPEGIDYLLFADGFTGSRGAARWNGANFTVISLSPFQSACDAGGFDIWSFNRTGLGIGSAFNLGASSYTDSNGSQVADFAPDTLPLWNYQLASTPSPPSPPPPTPPSPPPPPPPPPKPKTYQDAPKLPTRVRFVGNSIKHVRLGEKLYDTMQRLAKEGLIRVPRVVSVACWSREDWPSVAASAGFDGNPNLLSGFWLGRQPRWVHVAPKQCADVQALMLSRASNGQRAYALITVLHERVHAEGVDNEAETNCYAVQLVYDFARELGFPVTRALRLEQLGVRKARQVAPRGYWNAARCRDGGAWDLYSQYLNLSY